MNHRTCACPGCSCVSADPQVGVELGQRWYCCLACAEGHPGGKACADPHCSCAALPGEVGATSGLTLEDEEAVAG
ncbi:MAG: hypothetical protein GAK45_00205 [Pseudomonas citronellolis]|nr:MAG: hypothetical protein GAK45_00205 [Pseudomonas citronellolis]